MSCPRQAKHPWQSFTNKFAAMTEIASGSSLPEIPAALSPQVLCFMYERMYPCTSVFMYPCMHA